MAALRRAKMRIPQEDILAQNGHLNNTTRLTLGHLPLLSEIEIERVDFLWDGRIVLGKLNISDGDPGLGKTMWALDITARVTNGDTMPDGSPGIGPAGVVYFTAEDGPADTLRPRLEAANGDPRLVLPVTTIKLIDATGKEVERLPTFRDTALIKELIERVDAKLVVFDPMVAYLHAETNSYVDQSVRAELAPLALLAQETGAAILLIRHLNKSASCLACSFSSACWRFTSACCWAMLSIVGWLVFVVFVAGMSVSLRNAVSATGLISGGNITGRLAAFRPTT